MRSDLTTYLQRIDLREFGISALFAAMVLFITAMVMLDQNVSQVRTSFSSVERAYQVQKQIDAVNNRMAGVEMTVRGYALTGDPAFIERHQRSHAYVDAAIADLGRLIGSDTALEADYAALKLAVGRHEDLYGSLIGIGPDRQALVAQAITDPNKRAIQKAAIDALNRIEATELRLMAERRAKVEDGARMTYGIALAVAALAFLTGTLGFALVLFGKRQAVRPHA